VFDVIQIMNVFTAKMNVFTTKMNVFTAKMNNI